MIFIIGLKADRVIIIIISIINQTLDKVIRVLMIITLY